MAASGLRIPATRVGPGRYYAPWGCYGSGGCYRIDWEFSGDPGDARQSLRQDFFLLEGSGCCTICSPSPSGSDPAACGSFYAGQCLGPDDLVVRILDEDGLPSQAFVVFYTIFDSCGRLVLGRSQAAPGSAVGGYYAPWRTYASGNFQVKWEWMLSVDSPFESICACFSVVDPPAFFSVCGNDMPNFRQCPPGGSPQVIVVSGCCDDEVISRTVVLPEQTLPVGGQFTTQVAYVLSPKIRRVTFFVKYAQGVTGGFPVVRLMWGNGSEETQASIINGTFASFGAALATNQIRLNDLVGPVPNSDDPINFLIESTVPGGATSVRLLIAEGGMIGIPGSAEITLTGSSA